MVDLDYSLEIYDEFVGAYVENGTEDSVRNIAPNEAALEVFDEAEIRASWKMKKHEEAIVSLFLKDDTIISIIKRFRILLNMVWHLQRVRQDVSMGIIIMYITKKDHSVMVQWTLTGTYSYDGKNSSCQSANTTYTNYAANTYNVTLSSSRTSGNYAIGECKAVNKKKGREIAKTLYLGISADGKVIK